MERDLEGGEEDSESEDEIVEENCRGMVGAAVEDDATTSLGLKRASNFNDIGWEASRVVVVHS